MQQENHELTQVWKTVQRHQMLLQGDCVIVALSGGADSVALFHLLAAGQKTMGLRLLAAHLNHGLRGDAAEEDEIFVRALCEKEGVPLFVRRAEMAKAPRPKGEGEEALGRRLRYAFFEELATQHGAKVATGHTASDNAETVLFHAIRGSFTGGLAGVPPVRGVFIRPLLDVTRQQVRAFCIAQGHTYREDETNQNTVYTRNLLRLEALPVLEKAHKGAEKALCRLAEDMRQLDGWLREGALSLLQRAAKEALVNHIPGWHLPSYSAAALLAAPGPLRLQALALLAGPMAGRAALARMEAVLEGLQAAAALPGGKTVLLRNGRLLLVPCNPPPKNTQDKPLTMGEHLFAGGYRLLIQREELPTSGAIDQKKAKKGYTFRADYDKINQYGILRTRKEGDVFAPAGRGLHKPLKKWMIEAGVDRELRSCLPLLAEQGQVLWVWGAGFCEGLQPSAQTKHLLCIRAEYDQQEYGGRQYGQSEHF